MQLFKNKPLIFLITLFSVFFGQAQAALPFATAPSAAQISQFKALPSGQQQALAQKAGVDLSQVKSEHKIEPPPSIEEKTIEERDIEEEEATDKSHTNSNLAGRNAFGYKLFSGKPLTLSPLNDLPVPSNYILATGDQINIYLYGKENKKYNFTVNREGEIIFDTLGPINVAGMTFSALSNKIKEYIAQKKIGVEASVTMGKLRTMQILVLGEAYKPGAYVISSLATITQALKAAGGIKKTGSLRLVQIKRNNKIIGKIDLYDWLIKGNTSDDFRLQNGDVIFIPVKGTEVIISGHVQRPATYELKNKTSLQDAISLAGGIHAQTAFTQDILIERPTIKGIQAFNIDLHSNKSKRFFLKSGDKITVKTIPTHFQHEVTVIGNAIRTGVFEWRENMRISDIISDPEKDLLPLTDLQYALILRADPEITLFKFSLTAIFNNPASKQNLVLHNHDQIILFNIESAKSRQTLLAPAMSLLHQYSTLEKPFHYTTIAGAVNFPGKYPLFPGDKISELITAAGGFKEQSFTLSYQAIKEGKKLFESQEAITTEAESNNNITGVAANEYSSNLEYSFLFRMENNVETIKFKLKDILNNPTDFTNRELSHHDEVLIFDSLSENKRNLLLAPMLNKMRALSSLENPMHFVNIHGAVKFPGNYPLPKDAKLRDLLEIAGGLKESAYTLQAEISRYTRLDDQSTKLAHETIPLAKLIAGDEAANITLNTRDTVHILTAPDWLERYTITLSGEVKFPGNYLVRRGETLLDVVKRAGGITQYAYPKGAIFSRVRLREKEAQNIASIKERLRAEVGNMTFKKQSSTNPLSSNKPEQALALIDKLNTAQPLGRMVINLDKILAQNKEQNLLIENHDSLFVPALHKDITVTGHIQVPGSFIFDSTLTLEDYIDQSGGPLQQSDDDRIYVIRANGSVMLPNNSAWFSRTNQSLEPGDTIIVPIDTNYADPLDTLTAGTQILYQLGVAYTAISR